MSDVFVELKQRVLDIPGGEGWWNLDNATPFYDAGVSMLEKGFTLEETVSLLESLFRAVADEYGD